MQKPPYSPMPSFLTSAALRAGLGVSYLLLGILILATGHSQARILLGTVFLVMGAWYAAGFVAQKWTRR